MERILNTGHMQSINHRAGVITVAFTILHQEVGNF